MRIRERIKKARLTNDLIAYKMGVHRVTVSNWMTGKSKIPKDQEKRLLKLLRKIERPI